MAMRSSLLEKLPQGTAQMVDSNQLTWRLWQSRRVQAQQRPEAVQAP